jgi:hypothetical protein
MSQFFPGDFVRLPAKLEWGLGQVQSAENTRVTVTFENEGKVVIDTSVVELEFADPDVKF